VGNRFTKPQEFQERRRYCEADFSASEWRVLCTIAEREGGASSDEIVAAVYTLPRATVRAAVASLAGLGITRRGGSRDLGRYRKHKIIAKIEGLPKANPRKLRSERKCLSCGDPFLSAWVGNRICHACRNTEAFKGITSGISHKSKYAVKKETKQEALRLP
jgi:hypothetical protein